jgi:hypothetical protein
MVVGVVHPHIIALVDQNELLQLSYGQIKGESSEKQNKSSEKQNNGKQ